MYTEIVGSSNFIRNMFRTLDRIGSRKLYKTKAIRDQMYYCPDDFSVALQDIYLVRDELAKYFSLDDGEFVKNLYHPAGIWDCDNFAEAAKTGLCKLHMKRYLNGEHTIQYQYAVFCVTEKRKLLSSSIIHQYNVIVSKDGLLFFDMSQKEPLIHHDKRPNIINIS